MLNGKNPSKFEELFTVVETEEHIDWSINNALAKEYLLDYAER